MVIWVAVVQGGWAGMEVFMEQEGEGVAIDPGGASCEPPIRARG